MNTCICCSHNLLLHLRSQNFYWYCQHCRSEFNSFSSICQPSKPSKLEQIQSYSSCLIPAQ
ncbi:hypothetical protein [Pleurocapsa sp. FMAR1]|uniref:hypothetical protein n=1 Tax=Pleurocapsa sp. FMAR1 TaxID=3040204 RepID=UPI0029C876D1|nr:hypothetical protein [Pleurocapsa sp. FMAR1]